MATKSILRNVDINSKKSAKALVVALETAKDKHSQPSALSRTYEDIEGDALQEMLIKLFMHSKTAPGGNQERQDYSPEEYYSTFHIHSITFGTV